MRNNKLLAVDIETECALNCGLTKSKCMAAGHALIPHESRITVVGTWGPDEGDRRVFRGAALLEDLDEFIKTKRKQGYTLLFHEGRFDIKMLAYHMHGYEASYLDYWSDDSKLLAYVMTEKIPDKWLENYEALRNKINKKLPQGVSHRKASLHSLKTLAPYFLGVEPFWEDPSNHDNDDYVLKDVEYTYRLFNVLWERATDEERGFYRAHQIPWAKELMKAELQGIRIDNKTLETEAIEVKDKMQKAYNKVVNNWDLSEDFNLNSSKQLLELLRDRLGYNCVNFDGKESTAKDVLNRLAIEHRDVKDLLDYRDNMKLTTTFYPSYNRYQTDKGRIHCAFNTSNTRTGRLSSSFPNLQQQPEKTRHLFISDPGTSFIIRDLSGVEPVLIAYYTQDKNLLDIVTDPNKNFHNAVVPLIFPYVDCENKDVKKLYPAERAVTKTADLAIFYGSGARRLHTILFKAGFTNYTLQDCKKIVKRIRNHFKGVWDFKRQIDDLLERGETIYNLLGRPIKFDNPQDVYMKGFNRLIQGSGSDIVLEATREYNKECRSRGINSQGVILVHDELIVQAPDDKLEECDKLLDNCMTNFDLTKNSNEVKLETEGTISKYWEK